MRGRLPALVASGLFVAACGREPRTEAAADSTAAADSAAIMPVPVGGPTAQPATQPGATRSPTPETVVTVSEEVPGLLEQAKVLPIDAQYTAQTKFPNSRALAGTIERRGNDLVYVFRLRDNQTREVNDVLVSATDRTLINSIPVQDTTSPLGKGRKPPR